MSSQAQGAIFGYRWPLPEISLKKANFKSQGNYLLEVTNIEAMTPVFAVNDGNLIYHKDLNRFTITRPSPVVGYEHWEYQGLQLKSNPPASGFFKRVKAGDILGFTKSGGFEFGLHSSTFVKPIGVRSYEDPFKKLSFYGASFTSIPELGEAKFLVGAALLLLAWKVFK